jgi:hypothetical protein
MTVVSQLRRRVIDRSAVAAEACLNAVHVPLPATLLILGHMRSVATLLLHLLLMSDDNSGMGERNAVYASRADLSRLVLATRLARHSPFRRLRYVVDYYVERLEALAALAAGLANPGCAAFVTDEALVNSPQETLESLRQFLALREPLPQTYRTYSLMQ